MTETILRDMSETAKQAGSLIRSAYENVSTVSQKGMIDLVTEVDMASEQLILNQIQSAYPQATILAEETGLHHSKGNLRFVIDPLDGTVNFAHGIPYFCVLIAAQEQKATGVFQTFASVTYDPMREELFLAMQGEGATRNGKPIQVSTVDTLLHSLLVTGFGYERLYQQPDNHREFCRLNLLSQGVRRYGSAGLDMAYVSCGRLDGYWEYGLNPWDKAAGLLLIQEAGGVTTDLKGQVAHCDSPEIVAAGPALHRPLIEALRSAQNEEINSRAGLEAFLPADVAEKLHHTESISSEFSRDR